MGDSPPPTLPPTDSAVVPSAPAVDVRSFVSVMSRLQARVVRELRRETWFIVNETGDELATIPIEPGEEGNIRRVQVNGEVAEFSASHDLVLVRPRRPLRAGAGTIVVIHYR